MSGKNFDVFISYRRSDGDAIARILNAEFALRDFRCFLDFDSLGGGKFDEKIEAAILDAPVFVMVLTPDYFSRCNDKGDWVRREIELALANNKIIVPINYDKNLNGIPDYLEEDFKARIGCHNFATVHKDDTFKSSFNQMVEERILKIVGKIVKQEHKAKVSVIADTDCELIEDDEVIATVQKDKTNFILLEKGEHLITVRSSEFPQIKEKIEKTINDLSFKYLINIELEDKIKRLRDLETAKQKEAIEKQKAEEKRRQAEETARQQAKREAERRERERRQREEDARRREAEAEIRKAERKAWWKKNSGWIYGVFVAFVIVAIIFATIKTSSGTTETATETLTETITETQNETSIIEINALQTDNKDSIKVKGDNSSSKKLNNVSKQEKQIQVIVQNYSRLGFDVIGGLYSERLNAETVARIAIKKGYDSYVLVKEEDGTFLYYVSYGSRRSLKEANDLMEKIVEESGGKYYVMSR
ncbi:MAG: TIR domain-containing protein [Bacteroidales bacterium]|nr:TIR domain-containing protein [Bacteroidales bacterium]